MSKYLLPSLLALGIAGNECIDSQYLGTRAYEKNMVRAFTAGILSAQLCSNSNKVATGRLSYETLTGKRLSISVIKFRNFIEVILDGNTIRIDTHGSDHSINNNPVEFVLETKVFFDKERTSNLQLHLQNGIQGVYTRSGLFSHDWNISGDYAYTNKSEYQKIRVYYRLSNEFGISQEVSGVLECS